jgi:hypothetical protein
MITVISRRIKVKMEVNQEKSQGKITKIKVVFQELRNRCNQKSVHLEIPEKRKNNNQKMRVMKTKMKTVNQMNKIRSLAERAVSLVRASIAEKT